jgi:hypothetical protein
VIPTRKTGAAVPDSAKTVAARSQTLRGLSAAWMPIGIPIASYSTIDPKASESVTGRRSRMMTSTGCSDLNE